MEVWKDQLSELERSSHAVNSPEVTAELFVIPHEDQQLVYAPLRRAAFLASAGLVNRMMDLQEGTGDFEDSSTRSLVAFLRHLEILDGGPETPPVTRSTGEPHPTTVTLFLTTACNLRCTYCYAGAGKTPQKTMPLDVARRGIDFVISNAQKLARPGIEIIYHGGGEPTVNWDVLTRSFEYAWQRTRDVGLELRAGMATNGYLPPHKVEWAIQYLDSINVSVDGLPETHDAHRVTITGKGSSHRVMETLRLFDAADFTYSVRLTVTADQIGVFPESVRFLCEHCRPARLHVEPAFVIGRWNDALAVETQAFVEGFRAARTVARRYGRELYFSAADSTMLSNHFCGVSQDGFALTANGSVSACYEVFLENLPQADTFIYGRFDTDREAFQFDLPVLNNLRAQTVDQHDFCQGCFAKWSCSGDCYHRSLAVNGDRKFAGSNRCYIVRELTKDQILRNIAAAGGLYWKEPQGRIAYDQFGRDDTTKRTLRAGEETLETLAYPSATLASETEKGR